MSTLMTKHEYRGFTLVEQSSILEDDDYYTVWVDVDGGEWPFDTLDSAKAYIDELIDEMETRAEYQSRLTWFDRTTIGRICNM